MSSGGSTSYAVDPGAGDGKTCRFCGTDLPPDRAGTGVCGAQACHDQMIEEAGKALIARKRAKHAAVTEEVFAIVADDLTRAAAGTGRDPLSWMIPAQNEPLEPLPPARLEKFREHLQVCAAFAFRDPEPAPDTDLGARSKHEPDETPLADAACATCQGRCCKDRGGDTALLLPSDFSRFRQRNPGVTEQDVIDAYLAHLPANSTRDGCVYQAETGCTLPRAMRQDICNSYYCDPLRWLKMADDQRGGGETILVAAHQGVPERIAVVDADGGRAQVADFTGGET